MRSDRQAGFVDPVCSFLQLSFVKRLKYIVIKEAKEED